jgi:RNA polymerase sigma-70 factor (ECF subfamily)
VGVGNVPRLSWIHPRMDEPLRLVSESPLDERTLVSEQLSFETFFETEARTLFRRLCAVTGNSAEAEEIMQDAFLALWERWDRIDAIEDPTAYLYRTAMNVFRKRSRRAALAVRRALSLAPDIAPFSEIDEQQDVVAALAGLTPRQRAALVLTDVMDYSSEEAGRALGVTAGTVRGLASRARERLRRQVGERT